jgi:hypothetical protein
MSNRGMNYQMSIMVNSQIKLDSKYGYMHIYIIFKFKGINEQHWFKQKEEGR